MGLRNLADEALIKAYAKGREAAFEVLYLRHKDRVFHFLRRQTNNSALAEELAHDTWLAVIQGSDSYQHRAKFTTWVFSIAHNRLVDHWRKFATTRPALLEEVSEQFLRVEDQSTQLMQMRDLLRALEVLSEEQLAAMLLKIEGFSHAEIAEITQARPETVKSRLRYANNHLRKAVEATV